MKIKKIISEKNPPAKMWPQSTNGNHDLNKLELIKPYCPDVKLESTNLKMLAYKNYYSITFEFFRLIKFNFSLYPLPAQLWRQSTNGNHDVDKIEFIQSKHAFTQVTAWQAKCFLRKIFLMIFLYIFLICII